MFDEPDRHNALVASLRWKFHFRNVNRNCHAEPCHYPRQFLRRCSVLLIAAVLGGCNHKSAEDEIVVYCGVDEPYASKVFEEFEKQTGLHIAPEYDIESSKSVGLAGKLEAERRSSACRRLVGKRGVPERATGQRRRPHAVSICGGERTFRNNSRTPTVLERRRPASRVLAIGQGNAAPPFTITGIADWRPAAQG